jgi:DNA-binding NarL/FixJ family response regulator
MKTAHDVPKALRAKIRTRRGQILQAIWDGKTMKEIASDLGISDKTAQYHRAEMYRLLGVNNAISLCRRGLKLGLLRP